MKKTDIDLLQEAYEKILTIKEDTGMPHGQGYPNKKQQDFENTAHLDYVVDEDSDNINFPLFVTAYDKTREFGGHEEGGWYYTQFTPLESVEVHDHKNAEHVAQAMFDHYIDETDGVLIIYLENEKGSQIQDAPHYE